MESLRKSSFAVVASSLALAALTACSGAAPKKDAKPVETAAAAGEVKSEELSPQEQIQKLREKVLDLETRITALNEKINLESGALPRDSARGELASAAPATPSRPERELPVEHVKPAPAAAKVIPTSKTPNIRFAQDDNVDRFREAKIQYDAGRYADATVDFVAFTKDSPDHPLAPAAQYYVGLGYMKQKEFGRAEEELNRGLVSYPHSNYVPDTLLALLEIAMATQKKGRVTYYQQKISGTFPNSPQALKAALLINRPATESVPAMKSSAEPSLVTRPEAPVAPEAPRAAEGESQ